MQETKPGIPFKNRCNSIVLIILNCWVNFTIAQNPKITYSFINYGVNQGLPSSETYDLYQDPRTGFLWIATDRGVVKYNGYNFTTYTVDDGLTDNVVLKLSPDLFGNIWCHTNNNQFCYFDKNGRFQSFRYNQQLLKLAAKNSIIDMKTISLHFTKNKSLFLGPQNCSGEIIIDSLGKINWKIPIRPEKNNFLIFFPQEGYFHWSSNYESNYFYPVKDLAYGAIHKINDTVFVLTDFQKINIYKGLKLKKSLPTATITIQSGRVNDSLFWVSYKNGGVDFFTVNGDLKYHFLDNEIISDVIQDHEGGIWISTLSNGIFYLKNLRVKTFSSNLNSRISSISSLKEKLFLGYYSGEIFILNTTNFDYTCYKEFNVQSPVIVQSDTLNRCIYVASRSLAGWSGPDLKGSKSGAWGSTKISDDNINSTVFLSSYGGFITRNKDEFISIRTKIRVKDVSLLDKTIILSTNEGIFNYNGHKAIKIKAKELGFRIDDIDKFRDGLACASLGSGFIFYRKDTVFSIKKTNGLLSDLSTEVFVQNDSTVWLATAAGVNKIVFDKAYRYKIFDYTIADGLVSNEVVDIDMTKDNIWIATKKGLNFIGKNDNAMQDTPRLFLTIDKVIANGVKVNTSANKIQLGYNNNVEVFFNAISYSRNPLLSYRYKLLPGNTIWNTTTNRSIVFQAMLPESYTLVIQASTDNTHWREEVNFEINIASPFWKTWWFIALIVIALTLVVFLLFIYRLKQHKLKNNAIEMEMKALRAQMNPHFIFNSLASIQNFILTGNSNDSNKYLTKFSKLIRGVLENSKTELVTLKKELEILNLYIELEQLRVKPFELKLITDILLNTEKTQIPPLIIQPFIENAIWHGLEPSDKKGFLYIELKILKNKLQIVIEDNGVGRNHFKKNIAGIMSVKGKSYGIEITRERINALRKTHNLDIEISIIDKKDENNFPIGTRIEIELPIINLK